MLLIHEPPASFAARQESDDDYLAAWRAYHRALVAAGAYVDGAPLTTAASATTVRTRDGRRFVQDGPFAEAKEQLGGFVILDLPSLDAALSWAARCPAAAAGAVEIRPVDSGFLDAVLRD
ncbi:MAG: YciI family protein [Planctomycetota bacterium]